MYVFSPEIKYSFESIFGISKKLVKILPNIYLRLSLVDA